MFLTVLIVAIIIGYILKGKLSNIDASKINSIYLVFLAALLEILLVMAIRKGYLVRGVAAYLIYLLMYIILFVFTYKNRYNKWMILMGVGVVLNAIVIFSNGGVMPVSSAAVSHLGMTQSISSEGLYAAVNVDTRLSFLADIIPIKYPRSYIASAGDIVEAIAVAAFIITEMTSKKYKSNLVA